MSKLDMDKLKARRDALKNDGKKQDKDDGLYFRPGKGLGMGEEATFDIRVVPTPDGEPFRDLWFHYNVPKQKAGVMCPKRNFGEPCAICEFASDLWRQGVNNDNDEDKKMAKSLFARQRFFSPVVVRGQEDKGVQIYSYGKESYEFFLETIMDEEYGDITDVEKGFDVKLTYAAASKPGAFPSTKLKPARKESKLAATKAEIADLLGKVPDLDKEVGVRHTPEEIANILRHGLAAPTAEVGQEKYGAANSIDQEIAELEREAASA